MAYPVRVEMETVHRVSKLLFICWLTTLRLIKLVTFCLQSRFPGGSKTTCFASRLCRMKNTICRHARMFLAVGVRRVLCCGHQYKQMDRHHMNLLKSQNIRWHETFPQIWWSSAFRQCGTRGGECSHRPQPPLKFNFENAILYSVFCVCWGHFVFCVIVWLCAIIPGSCICVFTEAVKAANNKDRTWPQALRVSARKHLDGFLYKSTPRIYTEFSRGIFVLYRLSVTPDEYEIEKCVR